jgi:hypothetical protein
MADVGTLNVMAVLTSGCGIRSHAESRDASIVRLRRRTNQKRKCFHAPGIRPKETERERAKGLRGCTPVSEVAPLFSRLVKHAGLVL